MVLPRDSGSVGRCQASLLPRRIPPLPTFCREWPNHPLAGLGSAMQPERETRHAARTLMGEGNRGRVLRACRPGRAFDPVRCLRRDDPLHAPPAATRSSSVCLLLLPQLRGCDLGAERRVRPDLVEDDDRHEDRRDHGHDPQRIRARRRIVDREAVRRVEA
jgi:hypothetical protein